MTIKKSVLLFAVILQLCSCGGGGSQSSEVGLQAELDSSRSFAPGEAVPFTVSTTNFTLVPPFNMRGLQPRHHEGSEHEDSETDHEISDEIETGNSGDDHSHVNGVLNPDAREGHYHIYLDDAEGSDPHLTAWSSSGSYTLPSDIEEGTHTLRFELRDNEHVPVGIETVEFFDVVVQ